MAARKMREYRDANLVQCSRGGYALEGPGRERVERRLWSRRKDVSVSRHSSAASRISARAAPSAEFQLHQLQIVKALSSRGTYDSEHQWPENRVRDRPCTSYMTFEIHGDSKHVFARRLQCYYLDKNWQTSVFRSCFSKINLYAKCHGL